MSRKIPIKVTYSSMFLDGGMLRECSCTARLSVRPGTSMRTIALRIIRASLGKMPNSLETISDDQPVDIHLDGRTAAEAEAAPYGICYDLGRNGTVKFLDRYEPLNYDWTYGKLVELHRAGYISGDLSHIIIRTPLGLGGLNDFDLNILIGGIVATLGLAANIEGALQLKDRIKSSFQCRAMTKNFKQNGLYSWKQIRFLLETHETWTPKQLGKALAVSPSVATRILKKSGYSCQDGKWSFDNSSVESLELRKKWLKLEEQEEKKINKMLIEGS